MNRVENVTDEVADRTTGETLSHPANLPDDDRLVAGYQPMMWFMALLLAAFVAGCGGGDGKSTTSSAKAFTFFSLTWTTGTPGSAM